MKGTGFLALALMAGLTLGCNRGSQNTAANTPAATPGAVGTAGASEKGVPRADQTFVNDVAGMNMAEVDLSRLAAEKSATPDVKKFARMLVDEHTAAGDKLKTLASEQSIDVPAQLDDKDRDRHDKLAQEHGIDFDRDYIDAMIDGHKDLLNKLESRIDKEGLDRSKTEANPPASGKTVSEKGHTVAIVPEKSDNPVTARVNQWAADTYSAAAAHLDRAKALKDELKKRSTD
jgi:putative membrane protein